MPKLNVNVATREELVEKAGLRPELADAILKFRGKHGKITNVDELDEVHGIGPATLEQLRTTLDFSDKREKAGNGDDKAQEREKDPREAAVRTAEVAGSAARGGGVKVAQDTAEAGAQAASSAARSGLQLVQQTAGTMGELQRETARQSAEGTTELGKLWLELLNEQTRHNLAMVTALGRAVDWQEAVRVQSEYMRASFERMNRLNGRYLEIVQSMMRATTSAAKDQARKVA